MPARGVMKRETGLAAKQVSANFLHLRYCKRRLQVMDRGKDGDEWIVYKSCPAHVKAVCILADFFFLLRRGGGRVLSKYNKGWTNVQMERGHYERSSCMQQAGPVH